MASTDPYLSHLLTQIHDNLALLRSQKLLPQTSFDAILSYLPSIETERPMVPLPARESEGARRALPGAVALPSLRGTPPQEPTTPSAPRRAVPPPPPPLPSRSRTVYARAVWAYNKDQEDPDDLAFSPGDTIEILEEVNTDWWRGRAHGHEGIFPANYVTKLFPGAGAGMGAPPQYEDSSVPSASEKDTTGPAPQRRAYKPFGAAHHGRDAPPPAGSGGVNSLGLQEAPGREEKKSKFGKYGNTMAHSAAGGVGFGAGAAIGGGLVRAIF